MPTPHPHPRQARPQAILLALRLVAILGRFIPVLTLHQPRLGAHAIALGTCFRTAIARLAALLARLPALQPRLRTTSPAPEAPHTPREPSQTAPPPRLPRRPRWLLATLPEDAATLKAEIEALLAEPGATALLATYHAALRALRPLCRLLGITLPDPASTLPPARPQGPADLRNDPSLVWLEGPNYYRNGKPA